MEFIQLGSMIVVQSSCIGLLYFSLLLQQKMSKEGDPYLNDFFRMLSHFRVESKISQIVINLSSRTDLSPKGLISMLMLVYSLSFNKLCKEFLDEKFIKGLIGLLKEHQIQSLLEWPNSFGGGQVKLLLFRHVFKSYSEI